MVIQINAHEYFLLNLLVMLKLEALSLQGFAVLLCLRKLCLLCCALFKKASNIVGKSKCYIPVFLPTLYQISGLTTLSKTKSIIKCSWYLKLLLHKTFLFFQEISDGLI